MSKRRFQKTVGMMTGLALVTALGATAMQVSAQEGTGSFGRNAAENRMMQEGAGVLNMQDGRPGEMFIQMTGNVSLESEPGEIVTSTVVNTASALTVDEVNATTYVMSDENNQVKISSAGTYIVTGTCSDGNIVVKKGVTGVVLILRDLDLTSTTGATVSCNKNSEVKIIIDGSVKLTDAEDPADEDSTDETVADAFDGAALKAKDGSNVYLTGSGTLTIDASSCKNGIKVGDEDSPSFVIDGGLTINITAANDAINAGYDLTILSGNIGIWAGDDGIHADRILTLGSSDGSGPVINVYKSYEGLEGTVVNIFGGNGTINASDDAINAANSDGTYREEMEFSINITGGTYTVKCQGDGLDSNGNVNITGGYTTITSGSQGGEAGIDYDGTCYIADGTVNNNSGISGPDMMPGEMEGQFGEMNGQPDEIGGWFGGMNGQPDEMGGGQFGGMNGQPGEMGGQFGEMNGQPGEMGGQFGGMGGQPGEMGGWFGGMNGQPEQMPMQGGAGMPNR